jgi:cyclopropane fatty-acyl-phospholipid synthase-like methyltransferase
MLRGSLEILRGLFKEIGWRLTATKAERRHRKVGPLQLWKKKRAFQIRFLKDAGLKPTHRVLDIGCGTLRGGIPIIAFLDKGNYHGVEVRADVLEEGRKELREAGLEGKEPRLTVAESLRSLDLPVKFDYIWAYSVLLHMSDEILSDCLDFVDRHISQSGSLYANVCVGERRETRLGWQGFPVVWRSWDFYREAAARRSLHVEDWGTLESLGDVSDVRIMDEQRMLRFHRS